MISRAQENEGANTVDLKTNLRSSSLLQLRLLDRDHVIRLLLTPCGIWHFNLNLTLLFIFIFLCLFLLHLFFPSLPPLSASFYHSSSPSSSSSHSSFSSSFSSSSFYEIRLGYQIYYFKNHFYSSS